MIRVTLEYSSVDQAIVALGRLVGGHPLKAVESTASVKTVTGPPTASRKGRNDKGKPRGSYKNPPSAVAAPSTVAPAPAEGDKPQPSGPTPAATVPKAEDAQAALEKLFETKGPSAAQAVMSSFGVKRLRDLKEDQRADFIVASTKTLEAA